MFLDLRKEAVRNKSGSFKQHRKLLNYEKLGGSSLLYFAHMPSECRSIFFPGCALPGARPEQTIQLYLQLKKHIPDLGIMLDCCNKPSHDLGREQFFQNRFLARERLLRSKGITNIITACTNCYQAFSQNSTYLKTTTAYNLLADHGFTPETTFPDMNCTIQDPCTTRFEQKLHCDVRTLTERLKLQVVEMEHSRATTLCCGEGGASGCMKESQAGDWIEKRHKEAMGRPLITYCAGCTSTLQHKGPVFHIVDLLFPEEDTEHIQPTRIVPPRTYWNRLKLKFRLKRILDRPFFM